MKAIKSVWSAFKSKPLKFGIGILLLALSIFMFFGKVDINYKDSDREIGISTQAQK